MNLVIDTSVVIAVLASEPERKLLVRKTVGVDLIAPDSVHWEVGNALAAMLRRKRINLAQIRSLLKTYEEIPIRFVEVDLLDAMEIAAVHSLYAYDAYILSCARENRCKLISLDRGLLNAARNAGLSTIEVH